HQQMVEAVVAASDDHGVHPGLVLEREGVVDRRMRDLVAAFGKPVAQLVRVRREYDVYVQSALGVEALRLRGEHRQILHARENDDLELGIVGAGIRRCHEDADQRQDGKQTLHRKLLGCSRLESYNTGSAATLRRPNAASISRRTFTAKSPAS